MYTTWLADPSWSYGDKLVMSETKRGSAANYATMSVEDICQLYIPTVHHLEGGRITRTGGTLANHPVADDAFLWLWVTNSMILDGSGAEVCARWGFQPKQLITWVKGRIAVDRNSPNYDHDWPEAELILQIGMGRYTRNVTEQLILATRGKAASLVKSPRNNPNFILNEEDTIILEPRSNHSTKPQAQYSLIEKVCPGPYIELFARKRRAGWTSWGLEAPVDDVVMETEVTWI